MRVFLRNVLWMGPTFNRFDKTTLSLTCTYIFQKKNCICMCTYYTCFELKATIQLFFFVVDRISFTTGLLIGVLFKVGRNVLCVYMYKCTCVLPNVVLKLNLCIFSTQIHSCFMAVQQQILISIL